MSTTNHDQDNQQIEKKKINLQEAIKQQLAKKKQNQGQGNLNSQTANQPKKMKSQQTKKINNQRKRMGT
ncbi:hypothetical protein BTR23_02965 [Alkalihalophilus pseudofirmus]|uniref:hypothetical protein n=1 Tax=Alkalihalobacterium alkalinitrilicum TaxID=427920 RepID=UPI00094DE636|nr:hypothetical protein [Alkalihalobacterium alkalinitrilicum]OLO42199.1 hypothetical protein BTR23_02965 [Alkalihalophilus pseudofirmus]